MSFCEVLKEIDLFGKTPELYIHGRSKKITNIGRIFTFIFVIIYILIFSYKLYRLFKRVDITFYDSSPYINEFSTIKMTKDNFSLFFAVYDELYEPFIDESIYYPKAYFVDEDMELTEIKIERCNFDIISSNTKKLLEEQKITKINNYYCLSDINYELGQYKNSLYFQIFPCKNTSENNNHCKSKDIIDKNLNGGYLDIFFQDLLLTPLNYHNPIKERFNYIDSYVFKIFG